MINRVGTKNVLTLRLIAGKQQGDKMSPVSVIEYELSTICR